MFIDWTAQFCKDVPGPKIHLRFDAVPFTALTGFFVCVCEKRQAYSEIHMEMQKTTKRQSHLEGRP